MTVLAIRHSPDDRVLRHKATRVSRIDQPIQRLIDDMIQTMQQANGVGLAAPQVGVPLRVIVLQMPEEEPIAVINPEIINQSGEQEVTEGCLSVPGYFGKIKRAAEVIVKGKDRKGKPTRIKATGLLAGALQHEIDHLNGTLYVDHVLDEDRLYRLDAHETSAGTQAGRRQPRDYVG